MSKLTDLPVIILAAGRGNRLGSITDDIPKSMLQISHDTIIKRQIIALKHFGLNNIYIVSGYRSELLENHLSEFNVKFILNEEWAVTNNIYSLYLAKDFCKAGFYLFNGDVVFDFEILNDLISSQGTAMIIDNVKSLGHEEMKVTIKDEEIVDISKEIPVENSDGEYIGLLRFDKSGSKILFQELEKFITRDQRGVWYENAIVNLLDDLGIKPVYTKGRNWIEVDNEDDYIKMKELFEQ
jgi:choline kinase